MSDRCHRRRWEPQASREMWNSIWFLKSMTCLQWIRDLPISCLCVRMWAFQICIEPHHCASSSHWKPNQSKPDHNMCIWFAPPWQPQMPWGRIRYIFENMTRNERKHRLASCVLHIETHHHVSRCLRSFLRCFRITIDRARSIGHVRCWSRCGANYRQHRRDRLLRCVSLCMFDPISMRCVMVTDMIWQLLIGCSFLQFT